MSDDDSVDIIDEEEPKKRVRGKAAAKSKAPAKSAAKSVSKQASKKRARCVSVFHFHVNLCLASSLKVFYAKI